METTTYTSFDATTPTTVAEASGSYTLDIDALPLPFDRAQGLLEHVDLFGRVDLAAINVQHPDHEGSK